MINADLAHDIIIENTIPRFTYRHSDDYRIWMRNLKKSFIDVSKINVISKNACSPEFEIISEEIKDGYKQIRFEFYSGIGERVPCYLLIPDTDKKKYPVAITLQGHTSGFHLSLGISKYENDDSRFPNSAFGLQAVKNGFISLCIELKGLGERKPQHIKRRLCKLPICLNESNNAG